MHNVFVEVFHQNFYLILNVGCRVGLSKLKSNTEAFFCIFIIVMYDHGTLLLYDGWVG